MRSPTHTVIVLAVLCSLAGASPLLMPRGRAHAEPAPDQCATRAADDSTTLTVSPSSRYLMSTTQQHYWERSGCDRYVADFRVPHDLSWNGQTGFRLDLYRYSIGPVITAQNCSSVVEKATLYRKGPNEEAFTALGSYTIRGDVVNGVCRIQPGSSSAFATTYHPPPTGTAVYRVAAFISVGGDPQAGVTVKMGHGITLE